MSLFKAGWGDGCLGGAVDYSGSGGGGVVPFKRLSMSAIYVEAQKSLGTFHTKEVLSLF